MGNQDWKSRDEAYASKYAKPFNWKSFRNNMAAIVAFFALVGGVMWLLSR